jgi:hypothetical protein
MNKFHPRIHPANYPILAKYERDHPAVYALQQHAECRDFCVGKEIEWLHLEIPAIDQKWFSETRSKEQAFSALAYEFISYDLILDGWLEMAPEPTEVELSQLKDCDPLMRQLLDECENAAVQDANDAILPLITKVRAFLDAYRIALLTRFELCQIDWPATNNT